MVKWKNALSTAVLTTGLVFSSFAPVTYAKTSVVQKIQNLTNKQQPNSEAGKLPFIDQHNGGPFDIGLVNQDKVLKLLIKRGIVIKNASFQEQQKQMQAYFSKRAEKADTRGTTQKEMKEIRAKMQKKAGLKVRPAKAPVESGKIQPETWGGEKRTDKVLVLLIQFPDYPHNSITENDYPVLQYSDYNQQHYQDMIFGKNGYKGPNGQNLISVKKYYDQQSGGSYTIDGQVSKWYTASHPADYYGGNDPVYDSDQNPQALVKEALDLAAKDPSINLSNYDKEDKMDLDGDGIYNEPDGIIDHLMVIHSGVGEEAGGGSLGADAIWSHSWDLGQPYQIPNSNYAGMTYTIEPEDGAAGVFAHEFGHDLGLPDEYDTQYTADGVGAPTGAWSIMSSGSWAGALPGTEPTGFSPYDKEFLQSTMPDLNWFKDTNYKLNDLNNGKMVNLDEASVKGRNADAVKVELPDKATKVNDPFSGTYEFFSGSHSNLNNLMATKIDLTDKSTANLSFKTWYDIEQDFDYAYVGVISEDFKIIDFIPGNITTTANPYGQNQNNGITGKSKGWVDANFDLSAYAGKSFYLVFYYSTDAAVSLPGFFVDDIQVNADGKTLLSDNAEGPNSQFQMLGFTQNNGTVLTPQYYLLEWRNHAAADKGLAHIAAGPAYLTYDPGLVVWYVDDKYEDNWVGYHPGDGFLGVVDAHQATASWKDTDPNDEYLVNGVASTDYQIQDAAFSLDKTDQTTIDYSPYIGALLSLSPQPAATVFDDSRDYRNSGQVYAGRNVPNMGLKVHVVNEVSDKTGASIELHKGNIDSLIVNSLSKSIYSGQKGFNQLAVSGKVHRDGAGDSLTMKYEILNSKGTALISPISETVTGLDKSFSRTLTIPSKTLTGKYTLKVTATIGGKATSKTLSFSVDNDVPKVTASPNGSKTPIKEAQAKVTVSDANLGTLGYVWSQSTKAPYSGYKSFTNGSVLKQPGKNGIWYLYVQAKDKVGNSTTWKSNSFNLDSVKPTVTISPNGSTKPAKSVSPKVTVKDSNLSSYRYAWTKSAAAPKSGFKSFKNGTNLTSPKGDGKYYLHILAKDKAGNTVIFNSKSFLLDNKAPAKPQVDKIVSKEKLVTGHGEKGAKITVKAGKTVVTGYVNSKGKYSIKLKNALKVGTTVYVTATDTAGNKSSAAKTTVKKK